MPSACSPDHTVHLAAISIAADGWPQSLVTLNYWAIGDRPAPAADLRRYVRDFSIHPRRGDPQVVRFVNLLFRAFRSDIERLQDDKMATLAAYGRDTEELKFTPAQGGTAGVDETHIAAAMINQTAEEMKDVVRRAS